MANFDSNKWFKRQYLAEAGLLENEEVDALHDLLYNADPSYPKLAKALAKFLKGNIEDPNSGFTEGQINEFMKVLHAELGINESLNEEKSYDTYTVKITTSDPKEGGPNEDFTEKVKVDSSLTGDAIKASIKDTIYDMGYRHLYKLNYEKA